MNILKIVKSNIRKRLVFKLHSNLIIFQEFLKLTVDLADLVGIYFVMQKVAGKGQVKVIITLSVNIKTALFG